MNSKVYRARLVSFFIAICLFAHSLSHALLTVSAQINVRPTIQLMTPSATGASSATVFNVLWTDADPDDNASISLFLDSDPSGEDGIMIAVDLREDNSGTAGSYQLDVSVLPQGAYYLYALIDDGRNAPNMSYSPGRLVISGNSPSGTSAGATGGSFDVNHLGAATYTIPISVSPGTAGIEPKLAVAYNAHAGNGFLGVGWSLSGLSIITRCPATLAQDAAHDGVDFDALDRFCLDGERLIAVAGAYGSDGTKYRLEHEQFSEITSLGVAGSGPSTFVVRTKPGLRMEFSGISVPGRADAVYWVVSRITDTTGNYMTIRYATGAGNGDWAPSRIEYTGNASAGLLPYNRIEFSYETRPDPITQYLSGLVIENTRRLTSIKTFAGVNPGALVREYRFAYQTGMVSNRSHLSTITECGSDSTCFPPTNLQWIALTSRWGDLLKQRNSFWSAGSGTWIAHSGSNYFHGNFGGDSKHDLMTWNTSDKKWQVFISTGQGFVDAGRWTGGVDQFNTVLGDFNGDGLTDVASYSDVASQSWQVNLSSGSSFNKTGSGIWPNGPAPNAGTTLDKIGKEFFAADLNGDGKDDLIKYADPANTANKPGDWRIFFSNGSGFSGAQTWSAPGTTRERYVSVGKFNNDNTDDFIDYIGNGQWQVYLSTTTGFTRVASPWLGHWGGNSNNVVADFDGNGLDDIAGFTGNPQKDWHVCLTGGGFSCSMWLSASVNGASTVGADFNGDRRADLIHQKASGSSEWVIGLSGVIMVGDFSSPDTNFWGGHLGGYDRNITGDFNGDGKMDLAGYTGQGHDWHVVLSTGTQFTSPPSFWRGANIMPRGDLANVRTGDFNGDGKTDIATAAGGTWNLALSNGQGFVNHISQGLVAGPSGTAANILTGDFNGDGRTDFAGFATESRSWYITLANESGNGFQLQSLWAAAPKSDAANTIVADFNGDGKTDFAGYDAAIRKWHVALHAIQTNGTHAVDQGSGYWNGPTEGYSNTIQGDFNGDGKSDLAGYTTSPGLWRVFLSTGTGFVSSGGPNRDGLWVGHWGGAQNNVVGDFNGDALTDIAGFSPERQEWHVALSTGTSFTGLGTGFWKGVTSGSSKTVVADFNGDGKSDLAGFSPSQSSWHVAAPGGFHPDLLTMITTGIGKVTKIYYEPLTKGTVHQQMFDASYPRFDFSGPLYVVSQYEESNGVGGLSQYRYFYTDAETNLRGRGFRGFRSIRATDVQSGIETITSFSHDHLFGGYPTSSVQQTRAGNLISVVTNTLNYKAFGNGTSFSYIDLAREDTFEPKHGCKLVSPGVFSCAPIRTVLQDYSYNNVDVLYGNLSQLIVTATGGFTTTTTNTYINDEQRWILGRLVDSKIKHTASGRATIDRKSTFAYDITTGLLTRETSDPDTIFAVTKRYKYDQFGNITQSTLSSPGLIDRVSTTTYSSDGRFAISNRNALGHLETRTYSPLLGSVLTITSPNQLTATFSYDGFGRQTREQRADGTFVENYYLRCTSGCPANAVYRFEQRSIGEAPQTTYLDILDRPVRIATRNFNYQSIVTDTVFDTLGRTAQVSEPYVAGTTALWHRFEYDEIGRQVRVTFPDGSTSATQYEGLTEISTNQLGQRLTKTKNSKGWLVRSTDHLNGAMAYTYDAAGNLSTTIDPAGNTTTMAYDLANRRIQITDPNTGTSRFTYNAFGELISQTDAKNQTTTFTYDLLGRVLTRTMPEGTTTWTYDTASKGIGKLASVVQPWSNYSEVYTYDALSRQARSSTTFEGITYNGETYYNFWGRPSRTVSPAGLVLQTHYHVFGHVGAVQNGTTKRIYWELHEVSARGQVTRERFGNGAVTKKTYDPATGNLTGISTSAGPQLIQSLVYAFDPLGNLRSRGDTGANLSEAFTYDGLNRLNGTTLNGRPGLSVTYNAMGNIASKSDTGTYTYGATNAGPYQVRSISGPLGTFSYTYDANGNRVSGRNGTAIYTSFNKPESMTDLGASSKFTYNADLNRIKQVAVDGTRTTTTLYLGAFERRLVQSGSTTSREDLHYIAAPGGLIATVSTKTQNGTSDTRTSYLHLDHLGSVDSVTGETGQLVEKLSYDAFGNRRALNWQPSPFWLKPNMKRGFTSHEHFDNIHLINMNGRIYDPVIGRFLSADPFIQQPNFTQSHNRYTYVMNNPLSLTDPSGYFWKSITRFLEKHWRTVISVGIGIATGYGFLALAQSALGGIAGLTAAASAASWSGGFAFGSAFSGSLLSGKGVLDSFRTGLLLGAKAAATAYVTVSITTAVDRITNDLGTRWVIDSKGNATWLDPDQIGEAPRTIFTNGVLNSLQQAVKNGLSQHNRHPFVLVYNRTDGFLTDLIESSWDKIGGKTALSRTVADLLIELNGMATPFDAIAHSQGTLIMTSALQRVKSLGVALSNLRSAAYNGPAATSWVAKALLPSTTQFAHRSHFLDTVGNILGMHTANPFSIIGSVAAFPTLFTRWSFHSTYGPAFPDLYGRY